MQNVSFDIDIDDEHTVLGDNRMLVQTFFNLINNAIHAVNFNGKVTICSSVIGNKTIIKIADNGTGIEDGHVSKIFDPFYTTKDVTQNQGKTIKGTGLGLHLVYNYMKKMDAEISVVTEYGKGTLFSLTFKNG